tara:strand:- start:756 stop:968 length:213 start_codon:yes stop_codon:yes gene_type:complete
MTKNDKKNKNKLTCIDCEETTDDYYRIATNKGFIIKCSECYESWMTKMIRENIIAPNPHSRGGGLHYQDE